MLFAIFIQRYIIQLLLTVNNNNMIELTINLEVALKSGARVTLSEAQTRLAKSYIETLVTGEAPKEMLPSVAELKPTKRQYRRRGSHKSFSVEEDMLVAKLIQDFPVLPHGRNRARNQAIKQLARDLHRTENSISSRIWKIKNMPEKTGAPTPLTAQVIWS